MTVGRAQKPCHHHGAVQHSSRDRLKLSSWWLPYLQISQRCQAVERSGRYESDLIAVQLPIIQRAVKRVTLPCCNQAGEGQGYERINWQAIRDSQVLPKAAIYTTAPCLLPALHCHLGDHDTYSLIKDVNQLKAVVGRSVI